MPGKCAHYNCVKLEGPGTHPHDKCHHCTCGTCEKSRTSQGVRAPVGHVHKHVHNPVGHFWIAQPGYIIVGNHNFPGIQRTGYTVLHTGGGFGGHTGGTANCTNCHTGYNSGVVICKACHNDSFYCGSCQGYLGKKSYCSKC